MSSYRMCCAAGLLMVALGERAASAQPSRLQREFQDGVDAYRLGEYPEARAHLENARSLDPSLPGPHRFLAAVALAEKRYAECVEHAAEALRVAPRSREGDDTRKLHEECRLGLGRPRFAGKYGTGGAISVTARAEGETANAAVTIDGKASGSTPLFPRAIPVGDHDLVLTVAGVPPARVAVQVLPGIVTDLEVNLDDVAPSPEPVGWLELSEPWTSAAGIVVKIDGKVVKRRARMPVAPGRHVVVIEQGKQRWSQALKVKDGGATELHPVFAGKSRAAKKSRRR